MAEQSHDVPSGITDPDSEENQRILAQLDSTGLADTDTEVPTGGTPNAGQRIPDVPLP